MKESGEETRLELVRAVAAVMAAADALPGIEALAQDLEGADAACARGYFLPDEEELIRRQYHRYLVSRFALLEVMEELARLAGTGVIEWRQRLPVFATAFAAACVLMRAASGCFCGDAAATGGRTGCRCDLAGDGSSGQALRFPV